LIHSMRLSLMKGAHAGLCSAAWQEIGVKPSFGLSGIPELDEPLPVPHARPRRSRGYDRRAWPSPCAMAAIRGSLGPQRMQVQDVLLEVRQASVPTCANPRVARDFTGCGKTRCCKEPDSSRTVPAPDFLAAASISPGERFFKTRVNTPGYEFGVSQAAENSCFVSGHDFSRAVNKRDP
jgi:hypothetical protein